MTHMFTLGRSVDAMNSFPILVIVTMVLFVWLPEKISLIIYIHDRWKRDFWLFQKNSLISGMSPAPQLSPDPSSFSCKKKTIMLHSKYLFVCGLTVHQTLHCKKSLTTGPMVIKDKDKDKDKAISYHRPHGHLWNDLSRLLTIPVSVRLQKLAAQAHLV